MSIKRLEYNNKLKKHSDFEIIDLHHFLETRSKEHLQKDFRLDFWMLLYITEGSNKHNIDFIEYPYSRGDIILVHKNQVTHFSISNNVQGYLLLFNDNFFLDKNGVNGAPILEFFDKHYQSPIFNVNIEKMSTNRNLIELVYREYMQDNNIKNETLIRSLVQSFTLSLSDQMDMDDTLYKTRDFQIYNEFRSLLERHYRAKKTVSEYAEQMNLSNKTINQSVRKIAGLSAKEFINQRVILEIKRYLCIGDLLTYEISNMLNFEDPSYMTKFFKRYTGISPKEFRGSLL